MESTLLTEHNISQYFQSVETGTIPTDPDAAVFWDCMQDAEIHVLNNRLHVLVTPMDMACPTKQGIAPIAHQTGEHLLVQVFRGEGYNTEIGFRRPPRESAAFVIMSPLKKDVGDILIGDQTYQFLLLPFGFRNSSFPTPKNIRAPKPTRKSQR